MEPWTGAQGAFVVKAFYKNGDSFVIAQREFQREFGIHRNLAASSDQLRGYWFYTKEKGGSVKRVCKPENIAVVRDAIERIPHRSARRHSVSVGLSEARVRRILHKDIHLYPYRIQVTRALEPVVSKFRTQVLMAWADGTARLQRIPNSLRNSR
jgi:hypothetical protein